MAPLHTAFTQSSFRGSAKPRARNPWTPASGIWIPGSPLCGAPEWRPR